MAQPHFQSVNPATGQAGQSYPMLSPEELEAKLALAATGFETWRRSSAEDRTALLSRIADILSAERDAIARLITEEMGKPLSAAASEVDKCAAACRYYAEHGPAIIADQTIDLGEHKGLVRTLPLGPILAVMPWNFPLWQLVRFLAPAIMAGNVGLLKHAHSVPACALAIEDVVRRAGGPDGVFQSLFITSDQVAQVIADRRIAAVTLTGSERAGQAVAIAAGKALKKCVLELGGSDPFIVMPGADVDKAAAVAVGARMMNSGQSCVCAKRFIVHADVYDRFIEKALEAVAKLKVGDPLQEGIDMGPLASSDGRDTIARQVQAAVAAGGRVLVGGEAPDGPGAYYPPTLLVDLPIDAPIAQEEFFGPVALIFRAGDEAEALAMANATTFGLGSAIWSGDHEQQQRFIDGLQAGMTAVNGMVASDPRMPFGGVKQSGYGRELGPWGLHEFVNLKAVTLA